jgi:hypothetical protein
MATMSITSNDGTLASASAVLEVSATNPAYNQPALHIKARAAGPRRSESMTREAVESACEKGVFASPESEKATLRARIGRHCRSRMATCAQLVLRNDARAAAPHGPSALPAGRRHLHR